MGMEMGTNFYKQCDSNKFDIYDLPVSMKFVSFTIHNGYYNRFSRYSMSPLTLDIRHDTNNQYTQSNPDPHLNH